MSKYVHPLWQTNPVLAQTREALKEVEHIRRVLLELEAKARSFPSPAGAVDMNSVILKMHYIEDYLERLSGWSKSLNESEIGLHAMLGGKTKRFVSRRKHFLDQELMKWAMILGGRGALRLGSQVGGFLRDIL